MKHEKKWGVPLHFSSESWTWPEKKVPQGGWARLLQRGGIAWGTLTGISSHSAALGASAALLNPPFHNKPQNFPLRLMCCSPGREHGDGDYCIRAHWIFQEFWVFGLMPWGAFPSLLLLFGPAVALLYPFPVQVPVALGNKLQLLLVSSWVSPCELWILWETWAAAIKSLSPLSLNSIMDAVNCTSHVLDLWCCKMICALSSQTSRSASPSLGGLNSWGCQALVEDGPGLEGAVLKLSRASGQALLRRLNSLSH